MWLSTSSYRRFFTPREASEIIEHVRDHMKLLRAIAEEAQELGELSDERVGQHELHEERMKILKEEAQMVMDDLTRAGVVVQSLKPGQVAFPAMRNGQVAYLTWLEPSPNVSHWRLVHEDEDSLKPIQQPFSPSWAWDN